MSISVLFLIVALTGALGGLTNCLLAGEFTIPHSDVKRRVWNPGWISKILIGAIAAIVIWGAYGPAASYDLVSGQLGNFHLTVAQLVSSFLVGVSGAKILTTIAQKEAERISKVDLAQTLNDILKAKNEER